MAGLRFAVKADRSLKWVQLNKQLSQHEDRLCQTTISPLTYTNIMGISNACSHSFEMTAVVSH